MSRPKPIVVRLGACSLFAFLFALAVALPTASVSAQAKNPGQYPIAVPEKMERPTEKDADGLLQWVDLTKLKGDAAKALRCVTCEGKKWQLCAFCWRMEHHEKCPECKTSKDTDEKKRRATCRTCAGEGTMPDPLEKAPCPGCFGSTAQRCHVCAGEGTYAQAGTERRAKCPSCRGSGFYKCNVCKGKRLVEPPKLKPSVGEAERGDLEKALVSLEKVSAELAKWTSAGEVRDDRKAFGKIVKPGAKFFPALRTLGKDFDNAAKAHSKSAIFTATKQMIGNHSNERKQSLDFYIRHQRRLLQLCIERQKHNEKVLADKDKD